MTVRFLALGLLLAAAPVVAQHSKTARAKAFKLESVAPDASATPDAAATPTPDATPVPDSAAVTTPPPADPDTAPAAPNTSGMRASFTLDTPIADLIADPAAKAVLDKDLPGLSSDKNLDKFAKIGLRQFQPLTGGQLTDALLVKVARDLSKLSGPMLAPVTQPSGGKSKRNKDESR